MPTMLKTPVTLVLATLMVAAGVLGVIQVAQAQEDGAATEAVPVDGFYARTKTVACTGDIGCSMNHVVVRCRTGDAATGGAAWRINAGDPQPQLEQSRPHGGNPATAAFGWRVDGTIFLNPDAKLYVKVLCADLTP